MSANRKTRRAAKATDEFPALPTIPNLSGTKESCANCKFAADPERFKKILHLQRRPPNDPDTRLCLFAPGGGVNVMHFAWCSRWQEKDKK